MNQIAFHSIGCSLGNLTLYATDRGLCAITYESEAPKGAVANPAMLTPYADRLVRYLAGEREAFAQMPLDLSHGTPLQRKVWQALQQIPYGATISYSELASRVGKPDAVRAIGCACGKNPIPLAIPCHRVIAKNGTLGGFAWGIEVKRTLLGLEQGQKRHGA